MRASRLLFCLAVAAATPAFSQSFPERPIHIIVPQPPGGGYDLMGRVFAERLAPALGQPVVVDNKPGAGTLLGTDAAAKAAPDGYTLLVGGASNMALNVGLYAKLPYDPARDFTTIGFVVAWPYVLVARKDLPFKSLAELLAFARANPGKISYASAGRGTGQHVASAILEKIAGVQMTHVPYGGASPAYQDIIGGRVDIFFDALSTALPQIKGGAVRVLAMSTATRDPTVPDAPTLKEEGVNFDFSSWVGIFAPAATPAPVVTRLREEVARVRALPEVDDIIRKTGGVSQTMPGAEGDAVVRSEVERWSRLIREVGIAAE